MENCNHELVRVKECTKCGKTFDTIMPTADMDHLKELETDTIMRPSVLAPDQEEWRSLEKQYAESLGRLAQLCDTVIPWLQGAMSGVNDTDIPAEVRDGITEIMDYVDAVRP